MNQAGGVNCTGRGVAPRGAARLAVGRGQRGFTLLEMILVVSIILLLLSTLIVLAASAHVESQKVATRQLIEGVESALDSFYQRQGKYPDIALDPKVLPAPGAVSREDVQLAMLYIYLTDQWYGNCMPSVSESVTERLPEVTDTGRNYKGYSYLVDAWRNAIRFVAFDPQALQPEGEWPAASKGKLNNERRKWALNGGRPLVWSLGPDGKGWSLAAVRSTGTGTAEELRDLFYKPLDDATSDNADNISNFRDVPLNCLPVAQ